MSSFPTSNDRLNYLYRKQIDLGLDGDPRAAFKARVILRKLCGTIVLEPDADQSL